ncbi:hypothetical protein [Lysobacter sp. A3-1-A15]|uniref:hypothetical protein n=1 Tax=Novilysobacter viscosus TaxID=3098602 RepID=UPI002ED98AAE
MKNRYIPLGVILLAAGIGAIWSLVQFAGLQASLLWTAIIGAAAWAIRSSIEQRREYQRLLAEQKRKHYFEFLDFMSKFIDTSGDGRPPQLKRKPDQPVSLNEFRMWSLRLTLIGSDEVVKAWNHARLNETDAEDPLGVLKRWGRLWLAMRKDCGHPDTQLGVTDVLGSFVNDIEKSRAQLDRP